ncbi:unnamed protein product, partial [Adineta steineri]
YNRVWELSDRLCDFWVASDCMACTASILNLVAIAVDRYIAITKETTHTITIIIATRFGFLCRAYLSGFVTAI